MNRFVAPLTKDGVTEKVNSSPHPAALSPFEASKVKTRVYEKKAPGSGVPEHLLCPHSSRAFPLRYPRESDAHFKRRIECQFRDMPEAYHLHCFRWQIIGHLTFEGIGIREKVRWDMLTATLRKVCKSHRIYYPKLMWAVRTELGTQKDLTPHFHFLLAALPGHVDLNRFCHDFIAKWSAFGGGISVVTPFSRELDGAGYIAKCPETDNGLADGDCGLTFSDAARKYLRSIIKRERGI